MFLAVALIVLAAGWRILAVYAPALSNFAPLMALTFCSAVYFRDKRLWFVPMLGLTLSDFFLNAYYEHAFHATWGWQSELVRLACFALALPIGRVVAQHKSWLNLLSGALVASIAFYIVTNTDAWLTDPVYKQAGTSWWQALTVGRPEYTPTVFFFRNTFISDLLFTGVFAVAMEFAALRTGKTSLLAKNAAA
jgi:hypothetical protein